MTISLVHPFVSAVADGNDNGLVQPSDWNAEHTITLAADKLLGRISTAGAVQEIGIGSGLAFSAGNLILDTDLSDLSALTPTDSNIIVGNGTNWITESGDTARVSLGVGSSDSPQFTAVNIGHATDTTLTRVSAGVAAIEGSNILLASGLGSITQAYDATLASIAALGTAADKIAYTTGIDTWAETALTAFGRSIIDDADEATFKATVNLEIGTDVQAYDAELAALAGLTSAADALPYFTGSGTASTTTLTSAARSILDDTTVGAIATTLGLGTGDSPQFTAVNLGHASDTTLTRVSAGLIAVEGDTVALLTATQTLTNKTLTAPDINAGTADSLTSLSIRSTGAAFDLTFATSEVLSAGRTLSWVLGNAARTITLSGNPTLNDWFDQSVKTAANPQFATIELGAASDTTLARVSAGVVSIEGVTVATASNTLTLTSKTIDLTSNTLVGSVAEFNTALESADFGTFAAAQTDNAAVRADGTGGLLQTSALIISDTADLTAYDATNDGNPEFAFGASDAERLTISTIYDAGAQTLNYVIFETDVVSATADKGLFRFAPDLVTILDIDDGGINFAASKGISIAGTDILTDSAGTATLSNIDALDATTEATIEAAIDTLANLTSVQGQTLTLAGAFITSGANSLTLTTTGATNVTLPTTGTLATTTYVPTAITAANEATDTTCFLAFFTAASGDLGPKTNANLAFNSNTGVLTLTAPVLGTPTSGTLTNCSGLPIAGLTASTSTALGVGSVNLGHASDTTLARVSAGVVSIEGVNIVTTSSTDTLTNKTLTSPTLTTPVLGAATGTSVILSGLGVFGHTAQLSIGGNADNLESFGTTAATGGMALGMFNATAGTAAHFDFYRSKNASIGSATVVASGDALGNINWFGAQQTGTFATQTMAAQIRAEVDGTVTSGAGGDLPGRLVWATTADGGSAVTDRLILDSSGVLKPNANDGVALGTTALMFSDLFLASGAVINFNNGDITITHSTNALTFAGAGTANAYSFTGALAAGSLAFTIENTDFSAGSETSLVVKNDTTEIELSASGDENVGYFGSSNATFYLFTIGAFDITFNPGDVNALTLSNSDLSATFAGFVKSKHATGGMGYATGAGGAVTQLTSKATGVTVNTVCGQITLHNATLNAGVEVTFTVTNSACATTDCVVVNHDSVGTAGAYGIYANSIGAGSFAITVTNLSAGNLGEAIVLNFAIIKAVAA